MMLKLNGYNELSLDLGKAIRIMETHLQIKRDETLFFFNSSKPSQS